MSKKTVQNYFCQNFCRISTYCENFWHCPNVHKGQVMCFKAAQASAQFTLLSAQIYGESARELQNVDCSEFTWWWWYTNVILHLDSND